MPQYPAIIELSALNGDDGFRINGEAAEDTSGYSVSTAGDVNGDGFADLIIGAPSAAPNGAGTSYVVFGKAESFGASLDLSSLDGNNGFRIDGALDYDRSGRSVSSAGDVNGDGFDDLTIGAPDSSPNGGYSGAAFIVFGTDAAFASPFALSALDGNNGFRINGEDILYNTGFSVDSAGDFNDDGFDDLIVGAFGADPNGSASGASYVVFGKESGFDAAVELSGLDGTNGFRINGERNGDLSGWAVSQASDVNGDGVDDLLVGAMNSNPHGASSGATYVVFGTATAFGDTLELSALDGSDGFQISGVAALDQSGTSVSSAGDVNADGFADVIIGAPGADPNGDNSGAAYVLFGRATGFGSNVNLAILDGTRGFRIDGAAEGDGLGYSVSSAGDVNGDGFGDVIVGAWDADPNASNAGAAYVVFGKALGFDAAIDPSLLDGNNGFRIDGEAQDDSAGISVSAAGDLNGDGFDDLIVGAAYAGTYGSDNAGASYVIFGGMPGEAVTRAGSGIANTIHGGDFDDTLTGLGGDDTLLGHDGKDTIKAGLGNDTLEGGAGDDVLTGGSGADTFVYGSAEDSTGGAFDVIKKFDFTLDLFDLAPAVLAIDAAIETGTLRKAHFDGDLAAAVDEAHLAANDAVVFTPDAGNLAGEVFLVVDLNGVAGYQTGEDLVVGLGKPQEIASLGIEDFI